MEVSMFFNSVNGDRRYKAQDFANYFSKVLTNGVFPNPSTNLQIYSDNNMTVTVKQGGANINGYFYMLYADKKLVIDVANPTSDRKDLIVLRWDLLQRKIYLAIKKGTVEITKNEEVYELALAEILVKKGTATITQGDIKDLRQDSSKCGLVDSLIKIDSETLFNQFTEGFKIKQESFEKQFFDWFTKLKDTLGESAAGNLQNQIDMLNLKNDITGTTQRIIFENDYPKKILHVDKDSSVLRTDEFHFTEDLITETRTLSTGETLTYKYNLNTLEIEVI
ncbi:hypothetical protein [Clostridium sp. Marseille-Q7071]